MKKLIFLISMLLMLAGMLPANGQYRVTRDNTSVAVKSYDGHSVVNIDEDSGDKVRIQVAGVEMWLKQEPGQSAEPKVPFGKRHKIATPGHIGFIEVGLNTLPSPDYSMYAGGPYPFAESFLQLDHGRSLQWAFCLTDFSIKLAPYGIIALTSGVQMLWNNYVFSNPVTLVREEDRVLPEELSGNFRKSKISTFGFRIPVILELNFPQKIFVAGGIYGGVNLDTRTRVRNPRQITNNPHIKAFYYGATLRLGYDSFFVYGNCDLSPLFLDNRGPEVFPGTIGFGLSF